MSFTPGPWKIKQGSRWGEYMIYAPQKKAGRQVEQPVAFTVDHNARAIAQVPEMVDLLYKAHEKLADLNNNYELGDDNPVDLCFEIRKILRRIEGEDA